MQHVVGDAWKIKTNLAPNTLHVTISGEGFEKALYNSTTLQHAVRCRSREASFKEEITLGCKED